MSLGALAVPLLIAGTAVSAVGAIVQTSAAINAANYQASIARQQAEIDRENAARVEQTAQVEQQYRDEQTAAGIGSLLAQQGASGLATSGASQILTRKTAAELGRLDALNVRQAGDLSSYNYKVQSQQSDAAAAFANQRAQTSLLSGFLDTGATLIGGARQFIGQHAPPTQVYSNVTVPSPVMF